MDRSCFSYFDGVIVNNDTFVFIGIEDSKAKNEIRHGLVWKLQSGNWNHVEIAEPLTSCTLTEVNDYKFIAIAETGREFIIGDKSVRQEIVASELRSPTTYGPLTSIKCWQGNQIFAVGMARQIYKKISIDKWESIDQSCVPTTGDERAFSGFLDIGGYSEKEAYAIGTDGEIWMYDGSLWKLKDSPTNLMLHSIYCADNGFVYICGQNGIIVIGRQDYWKIIDQDVTEEDFRGICYFNNEVYLCSSNLIYKIRENKLIQAPIETPYLTSGRLKSENELLMSVGLKDILIYDGFNWINLLL